MQAEIHKPRGAGIEVELPSKHQKFSLSQGFKVKLTTFDACILKLRHSEIEIYLSCIRLDFRA